MGDTPTVTYSYNKLEKVWDIFETVGGETQLLFSFHTKKEAIDHIKWQTKPDEEEESFDDTDEEITLEKIDRYIEEQKVLADKEERSKFHKDYSDGHEQRELRRLETVRKLLVAGASNMRWGYGCVYIQEGDTTFCFYLLKQKWSAAKNPTGGKVSWRKRKSYYCKSPEDFVEKYVLKSKKVEG